MKSIWNRQNWMNFFPGNRKHPPFNGTFMKRNTNPLTQWDAHRKKKINNSHCNIFIEFQHVIHWKWRTGSIRIWNFRSACIHLHFNPSNWRSAIFFFNLYWNQFKLTHKKWTISRKKLNDKYFIHSKKENSSP